MTTYAYRYIWHTTFKTGAIPPTTMIKTQKLFQPVTIETTKVHFYCDYILIPNWQCFW